MDNMVIEFLNFLSGVAGLLPGSLVAGAVAMGVLATAVFFLSLRGPKFIYIAELA